MPGEVDPRLMGLLQAVLGLADALRDAGTSGPVTVRLDREDGLLLLKLVAGANDAEAEAWSQRGQPPETGVNCLKVAGLTFEWPQVKVMPGGVGAAANENSRRPAVESYPGVLDGAVAFWAAPGQIVAGLTADPGGPSSG
jgi:hypothetical protein